MTFRLMSHWRLRAGVLSDRQETAGKADPNKKIIRFADYVTPATPRHTLIGSVLFLRFLPESVFISLVWHAIHVGICAVIAYYGADLVSYNWMLALAGLSVALVLSYTMLSVLFDYGFLVTVVPPVLVIAAGYWIPAMVDLSITVAVMIAASVALIYRSS